MSDANPKWLIRTISLPPGKLATLSLAIMAIGVIIPLIATDSSTWRQAILTMTAASLLIAIGRLAMGGIRRRGDDLIITTAFSRFVVPLTTLASAGLKTNRLGGHEIELESTTGERLPTGVIEGGAGTEVQLVVDNLNAACGAPSIANQAADSAK